MQRNIIDATWIVTANASRARFFAEPAQTTAQHATDLFAKEVARYRLKAYQEGRYREIALVASL